VINVKIIAGASTRNVVLGASDDYFAASLISMP
jgi:hypothetical protein